MLALESDRLVLDAPSDRDVPAMVACLNDFEVSKNLSTAPFPYDETAAKRFVALAVAGRVSGTAYIFAIRLRSGGNHIGQCGLHLQDKRVELGYTIARPYWGHGYATEAARLLLEFGFATLNLETMQAGWFADNPSSGRVLEKLGFVMDRIEQWPCLARGQSVPCHRGQLTRARFGRNKTDRIRSHHEIS